MKILDAALLSTAIGLTCSTLFLFASDYPEGYVPTILPPPLETSVPRSKEFLAIVIHGASDDCRKSDPGSRDSRAHFVVPMENEQGAVRIESTPRWREQLAAAHTRNLVVNRRSIAVWVEIPVPGADPSPAQKAALADLISRLRAQYGIPEDRVFAHADVDVQTSCGSGLALAFAKP